MVAALYRPIAERHQQYADALIADELFELSPTIDYSQFDFLASEARQRLAQARPTTLVSLGIRSEQPRKLTEAVIGRVKQSALKESTPRRWVSSLTGCVAWQPQFDAVQGLAIMHYHHVYTAV